MSIAYVSYIDTASVSSMESGPLSASTSRDTSSASNVAYRGGRQDKNGQGRPIVVRTVKELLQARKSFDSRQWTRADGSPGKFRKHIALVPCLGGLHQGHLELFRAAKKLSNVEVWGSLFLNRLQFQRQHDFDSYPMNVEQDIDTLKEFCDVIFASTDLSDIHPFHTSLYSDQCHAKNELDKCAGERVNYEKSAGASFSNILCEKKSLATDQNQFGTPYVDFIDIENTQGEGMCRPGFFRGVGTIVMKYLQWIRPDFLFIGQKDFIQTQVIRNLCTDYARSCRPVIHPTVRRSVDGLPLASRNARITEEQQNEGGVEIVYSSQRCVQEAFRSGERRVGRLLLLGLEHILRHGDEKIGNLAYLTLNDWFTGREFGSITKSDIIDQDRTLSAGKKIDDNSVPTPPPGYRLTVHYKGVAPCRISTNNHCQLSSPTMKISSESGKKPEWMSVSCFDLGTTGIPKGRAFALSVFPPSGSLNLETPSDPPLEALISSLPIDFSDYSLQSPGRFCLTIGFALSPFCRIVDNIVLCDYADILGDLLTTNFSGIKMQEKVGESIGGRVQPLASSLPRMDTIGGARDADRNDLRLESRDGAFCVGGSPSAMLLATAGFYFRMATAKDLKKIAALEKSSFQKGEASDEETIHYRITEAGEFFCCLMKRNDETVERRCDGDVGVTDNEDLVGFVCGTLFQGDTLTEQTMRLGGHDRDGDRLAIHSVVIAPEFRSLGYASHLVEEYLRHVARLPWAEKTFGNVVCDEASSKASMGVKTKSDYHGCDRPTIHVIAHSYLVDFYQYNCSFETVGTWGGVWGPDPWKEMIRKL